MEKLIDLLRTSDTFRVCAIVAVLGGGFLASGTVKEELMERKARQEAERLQKDPAGYLLDTGRKLLEERERALREGRH